MIVNLYKRNFLKKSVNFLILIFSINIFFPKNKYFCINKNFSFADKNYQTKTVKFIFLNYFKGNISAKKIIQNIEKRRSLSHIQYKENIKYIINKNKFA